MARRRLASVQSLLRDRDADRDRGRDDGADLGGWSGSAAGERAEVLPDPVERQDGEECETRGSTRDGCPAGPARPQMATKGSAFGSVEDAPGEAPNRRAVEPLAEGERFGEP